jgi:hypothetical protein
MEIGWRLDWILANVSGEKITRATAKASYSIMNILTKNQDDVKH